MNDKEEKLFPDTERIHDINIGKAQAYLGTYKGSGDREKFNEIYKQFADRQQIVADIALFCRFSLDFYYFLPEHDPIKSEPEVVLGAMYHKPDWFSRIKIEDDICLDINKNALNMKERSLYLHLMQGDNLRYCFNALSEDVMFMREYGKMKGYKFDIGGLDYRGNGVFYRRGQPYDPSKSFSENAKLRRERLPIAGPNDDEQN